MRHAARLEDGRRPCLCMERLWSVPTAPLVNSGSLVLEMARTKAATIWGLFMMAWWLASFLLSWRTIMAAWDTTTWSSALSSLMSSGMARLTRMALSW